MLHYQLMFICLDFLHCCFDNFRYLISSEEYIRRKSSTSLNYQATRENRQRICKETNCACGIKHSLVRTTIATEVETRFK